MKLSKPAQLVNWEIEVQDKKEFKTVIITVETKTGCNYTQAFEYYGAPIPGFASRVNETIKTGVNNYESYLRWNQLIITIGEILLALLCLIPLLYIAYKTLTTSF